MDFFKSLSFPLITLLYFLMACKEEVDPPLDCSSLTLNLVSKNDISNCSVQNGQIVVQASAGVEPFTYKMGGLQNSNGTFSNLKAGDYTITVSDGNGQCKASIEVSLNISGSEFSITAEGTASSVCAPNSNGFITVTASNGVEPYRYRTSTGPFQTENVIPNLGPGSYLVEVIDDQDCSINITVEVPGIRYETIKSIIDFNCAISGCHNGDIGAHNNYTNFDNVKENSTGIRATTADRSMPPAGNLSQDQIDLIACWVAEGANK